MVTDGAGESRSRLAVVRRGYVSCNLVSSFGIQSFNLVSSLLLGHVRIADVGLVGVGGAKTTVGWLLDMCLDLLLGLPVGRAVLVGLSICGSVFSGHFALNAVGSVLGGLGGSMALGSLRGALDVGADEEANKQSAKCTLVYPPPTLL